MGFVVSAFWGAVIGVVAGWFLGEMMTGGTWAGGYFPGGILGLAIGVGVPLVGRYNEQVRERDRMAALAASQRAQDEADAEARVRDREEALARALSNLTDNARGALAAVASLPGHFSDANLAYGKAVHFYNDGAFSPFWSEIERAYGSLAEYRRQMDAATRAATRHALLLSGVRQAGGSTMEIFDFPVSIPAKKLEADAEIATSELGRLVYRAQKEPVFAQIWEQRRTTTAVVTGFASLELAIDQMAGALTTSVRELQSELASATRAASRTASRDSARLTNLGYAQLREMEKLTAEADDIRRNVFRQTWGISPTK